LPRADLDARLGGAGLFLRTGLFLYHISSQIDSVADGLCALYSDFPIADTAEFADYHVRLLRRRNWRRLGWDIGVRLGGATPLSPLPIGQAFAVFEGCLNWCVYTHAHQYLIVHAAAVEKGGRTAIMPAPPGAGKSTLCAALVNSGWRLLSAYPA
jgi:HprK-related kinase A